MTNWAGFTDDDLRKLKGKDENHKGGLGIKVNPKAMSTTSSKPIAKRLGPSRQTPPRTATVPTAAFLSQPKQIPSALQYKPSDEELDSLRAKKALNPTGPGESNVVTKNNVEEKVKSPPPEETKPPDGDNDMLLDEDEILSKEIDNIEKFRQNQKKIEDMNKRKKLALYDAIQQRQKMAKTEEKKLVAIHRELKALDAMVTNDISVVRDKIEEASREFFEAQKRYERIEHEFVEAKMDLHRKEGTKENLTDHLYTIIHQNEVRKAKKLAQLMHKLNMDESGDEEALVGEAEHMEMPCVTLFQPVVKRKGKETEKENEKEAEKEAEKEKEKNTEEPQKEKEEIEGEKVEKKDEKVENKEEKVETESVKKEEDKKEEDIPLQAVVT